MRNHLIGLGKGVRGTPPHTSVEPLLSFFQQCEGWPVISHRAHNFLTRPPTGTPRRVISPCEGSLRPRVPRAQKIIRLHPFLCSASKKGSGDSDHSSGCVDSKCTLEGWRDSIRGAGYREEADTCALACYNNSFNLPASYPPLDPIP
jgi:hypothetical protein